uniref:MSP domain-containing protein n=1 Tax=Caenorhabditis japonica TaxID=281687 RepID=A0A8R1I363_CAEJA
MDPQLELAEEPKKQWKYVTVEDYPFEFDTELVAFVGALEDDDCTAYFTIRNTQPTIQKFGIKATKLASKFRIDPPKGSIRPHEEREIAVKYKGPCMKAPYFVNLKIMAYTIVGDTVFKSTKRLGMIFVFVPNYKVNRMRIRCDELWERYCSPLAQKEDVDDADDDGKMVSCC